MKPTRSPSLYDRLGGAKAIELMISSFYTRMLADPVLSPLFQHITIERLHAMQRSFLTMATGGPSSRVSRSLALASDDNTFTHEHFARFARHLLDTLAAYGISEMEAREVAARIRSHKGDLVVTAG